MQQPFAIRTLAHLGMVAVAVIVLVTPPGPSREVQAASHREAPAISEDPEADITDVFFFRSYESGKADKVVLIMDVIPGEEPSSGPNYWNFDPDVLYAFNLDTDADGVADDVVFEFRFNTEIRGVCKDLGLPLSFVALPPITRLDGSGSEGLCLRQKYSVTMVRERVRRQADDDRDDDEAAAANRGNRRVLADDLIAVPSNVGPRTTPNYDALASQGIRDLGNGIRVFAGQRQDPFSIDLGGVFDTLNLRRNPPLLSQAEDADDTRNPFGVDMLSGFNVHTIALEVPASLLTRDGKGPGETTQPKLGLYASTSRRNVTVLRAPNGSNGHGQGRFVQVQRLANPLINELFIGTVDKDRWNATEPDEEGQFLDYYRNPRLALALETVFGVPAAKTDRNDLVDALLRYAPGPASPTAQASPTVQGKPTGQPGRPGNERRDGTLSELLRLDVSVAPTPLGQQKRLGALLSTDKAGWPNGRRPKDDVTDVAIRVVGGPNFVNGRAGDGVNVDDAALIDKFPFLATPANGRDRVHTNP